MTLVKRISLSQFVLAGGVLPRGYGVAWVEFTGDKAVCLPIPLNIVAGAVRTAWQRLRIWRAPDLLKAEYSRGHKDGHAAGYKSGREHGARFGAYVERIVSMEEFAADPEKFLGRPH